MLTTILTLVGIFGPPVINWIQKSHGNSSGNPAAGAAKAAAAQALMIQLIELFKTAGLIDPKAAVDVNAVAAAIEALFQSMKASGTLLTPGTPAVPANPAPSADPLTGKTLTILVKEVKQ